MLQQTHLNSVFLLHLHKDKTDNINLTKVAHEFILEKEKIFWLILIIIISPNHSPKTHTLLTAAFGCTFVVPPQSKTSSFTHDHETRNIEGQTKPINYTHYTHSPEGFMVST